MPPKGSTTPFPVLPNPSKQRNPTLPHPGPSLTVSPVCLPLPSPCPFPGVCAWEQRESSCASGEKSKWKQEREPEKQGVTGPSKIPAGSLSGFFWSPDINNLGNPTWPALPTLPPAHESPFPSNKHLPRGHNTTQEKVNGGHMLGGGLRPRGSLENCFCSQQITLRIFHIKLKSLSFPSKIRSSGNANQPTLEGGTPQFTTVPDCLLHCCLWVPTWHPQATPPWG